MPPAAIVAVFTAGKIYSRISYPFRRSHAAAQRKFSIARKNIHFYQKLQSCKPSEYALKLAKQNAMGQNPTAFIAYLANLNLHFQKEEIKKMFRHLDWSDRLRIESLYNTGHTCLYIAKYLGFSPSSIYREVKHGLYEHLGAETTKRPYHYSAQIAQDYADYQATSKGSEIKLGKNYAYAKEVAAQIKQGVSIDTIVNVKKKKGQWTVSTTTLYRYVDLGYIPNVTNKLLPEKNHRKKRHPHTVKAAKAPKGLPIDRRPQDIDARTAFGHWEFDSVIGKANGKKQSILTLTERKTRYEIIFRAAAKTSAATVAALDKIIRQFPKGTFQTITVDNGSEFQDCYGMEHDPQGNKRLTIYYAHPYCSWERGTNERNNRIVRRFFPKGRSMAKLTQKDCDKAAKTINAMPRKILGWHTAEELFEQEIANLVNQP